MRETIANFAIAFEYYERQGIRCRFVFTTTAAAVLQQIDASITVDVLKHWQAYTESPSDHRNAPLVSSIKALEEYRKVGTERGRRRYDQVAASYAYLDEGRWDRFLRAVRWRLCDESYAAVRQRLADAIANDSRFSQFSSGLILARLVGEVLHHSANEDLSGRVLRPGDLADIARETDADHRTWAEKRPFALWVARFEDKLVDVHERVARLEAQAGLSAAEDLWPRYTEWLRQRVQHISLLGLPALQVPILHALPVRVLRADKDRGAFEGRYLHLMDEARILLTGEPGTGKSGLTRQVAASAIAAGVKVVRGRLKVVATELSRGMPMADALSVGVAEGFFGYSGRNRLISEAELVLLDGLDETSTSHQVIVEHLKSWQSSAKLLVTSRNAEDAAQLGGFVHCKIQSIESHCAVVFARRVAQVRGDVEPAVLDRIEQLFLSHPELVTPLLAGFVLSIAFAAQRDPVPTTPAKLYNRILMLLARAAHTDKTFEVRMDAECAIQVLASLAWYRIEAPTADLLELKTKLRQVHGVDGATAFDFWEERGLLESRTSAIRDDIDFAHESLWEHCVARHISSLPNEEVERITSRHADEASWSQILQFAIQLGHAQPILRGVLTSTEHRRTLRAAFLSTLTLEPFDSALLLERLLEAVASGIPTVVAEAATLLASLVEQGRVDGNRIASRFLEHENLESTWDRLGVLSIRISLVVRGAQDGDIAKWLLTEADAHSRNSVLSGQRALSWWSSFQDIIVRGISGVCTSQGADAAVQLLSELKKRELLTEYSRNAIRGWAVHESHVRIREIVDSMDASEAAALAAMAKAKNGMSLEDFEEKRLESLYLVFSEACPETGSAGDAGGSFALALESFGYLERPNTEGTIFMGPKVRKLLAPVVRQWVMSLRLEPAAVGDFAREMLPKRPLVHSIVEWPRAPSRIPQWDPQRIASAGIRLPDLVSMLNTGSHNGLLIKLIGPMLLSWQPHSELAEVIESQATELNADMWQWLVRNAEKVWGSQFEDRATELIRKFEVLPGSAG